MNNKEQVLETVKAMIEWQGITQEELYPTISTPQSDVEDKNWEIVAFKLVRNGELMKLHTNGCYEYENYDFEKNSIGAVCTLKDMLHEGTCVDSGDFLIWSVKKLSTGEIFTVGDKICWDWSKSDLKYFDIVKFSINEYDGHMTIHTDNSCIGFNMVFMLECNLRHYTEPIEQKEVLFITEDGVEITDPETTIWSVSDVWPLESSPDKTKVKRIGDWVLPGGSAADIWHHFSTQEAAQAYIDSKKVKVPLLITTDGVEIYDAQQEVYLLMDIFVHYNHSVTVSEALKWKSGKWFSSAEARDEYVIEHKPLFSIADMKRMERESGEKNDEFLVCMQWKIIKQEAINHIKANS